MKFVQTGESRWDMLPWFHRKPINQGAEIALSSGPLLGYPVSSYELTHVFRAVFPNASLLQLHLPCKHN